MTNFPLPSTVAYPRSSDPSTCHLLLTKHLSTSPSAGAGKEGVPVQVYVLEMRNLPDNRLTTDFIRECWFPALDDIKAEWELDAGQDLKGGPGTGAATLIITGETKAHKFFSNGLDLEVAVQTPGFFKDVYHALLGRVLTFPIPTVAAINGHAFAGGMCLAMACDERVMKGTEGRGRAMMCMNEIDFGAPIPQPMINILRCKLPTPAIFRQCVLLGHRFSAQECEKEGMVRALGKDGPETIEKAVQVGVAMAEKARREAWGSMKESMYDWEMEVIREWEGGMDVDTVKKSKKGGAKL